MVGEKSKDVGGDGERGGYRGEEKRGSKAVVDFTF